MIPLTERGKQIRRDTITLSKANGGYHFGGSFSCVEILMAIYDKAQPDEKFILSKGHGCWPLYVILRERGLVPKLEGHPSLDPANGVHYTTGSMGHGLPGAVGMALARKIHGKPGRIIVLIGDGECQEGTTWESLNIAARHHLDNLVVIVDANDIQGSGRTDDILPMWKTLDCACAIGWRTRMVDGHSIGDLDDAIRISHPRRPVFVWAQTIKGRGVSFMEGKPEWHAKWLDDEHEALAMKELA